jgi:hypothetical protein
MVLENHLASTERACTYSAGKAGRQHSVVNFQSRLFRYVILCRFQEYSVRQFQCQKPMDLGSVVPVALKMAIDNSTDCVWVKVWPRQRTRVQEHFPHIVGKLVAIPHSKMKWLVAAKPDAFQVKPGKQVVHLRNPLWHPGVVGVFCLEQKLEEGVSEGGFHIAEAEVRP